MRKFKEFDRMCAELQQANVDVVIIAFPSVIGDTYKEIIENLSKLADANLQLAVAKRQPRDGETEDEEVSG